MKQQQENESAEEYLDSIRSKRDGQTGTVRKPKKNSMMANFKRRLMAKEQRDEMLKTALVKDATFTRIMGPAGSSAPSSAARSRSRASSGTISGRTGSASDSKYDEFEQADEESGVLEEDDEGLSEQEREEKEYLDQLLHDASMDPMFHVSS
eukprot:TRINITY_DN8748_c0_g3_i3.p1 TRINITY_DN8748_c0_g3~~TRINITY_DN8748_c0_g3_i3.p1  ORF type:complete len:152 (+),score=53.97 TRINITY_DN8748_c0_g3_i3:127-582(+)